MPELILKNDSRVNLIYFHPAALNYHSLIFNPAIKLIPAIG